jgi:hypothetical protein
MAVCSHLALLTSHLFPAFGTPSALVRFVVSIGLLFAVKADSF